MVLAADKKAEARFASTKKEMSRMASLLHRTSQKTAQILFKRCCSGCRYGAECCAYAWRKMCMAGRARLSARESFGLESLTWLDVKGETKKKKKPGAAVFPQKEVPLTVNHVIWT